MKIGLVCPYNFTRGGGVQEHVRETAVELRRRGHQVSIITPLPRDTEASRLDGVIFIGTSTDFRSPMHTTSQIAGTADMNKLEELLKKEHFDILHFHEPWQPLLSRQILQRSTSVNVATFHAKVPETLMSRTVVKVVTPYLKSVMRYLHELTAVSESAAEYAASLTDKPITIIPNGIDLTLYKPSSAAKTVNKPRTILFVGRLERRKGVKYLLRAYKLLTQEENNVRLIITGDGPDRDKLEMLASDMGLKGVSFLGFVSDDLKIELLEEADLFCSPAVFGESFGIVLLEAMATGTVCVAGNNSGYSDVMQGLGAVSIVNPQDSVEFARRLKLLLDNQELRDSWRAWALEYVQQFSYSRIVDSYEVLYKEALDQHDSRS